MDLAFFLRGLLIGFSIAAPVGPIGILAIRRTLTLGRWAGLLTGLGAATADALYGCIAGFGLTAISELLIDQAFWLKLVGGIFLCYLGIKTFMSQPAEAAAVDDQPAHLSRTHVSMAYLSMYASTVLLTLTNPATILSFAAVFVGLGLAQMGSNYLTASVLVAGVFCGSALWWLLLSSGANLLRRKITPQSLRALNRISGLILLTFGIIALSAKS
ncbi:MAG: LysE family translocator [Oscillatoriophycideae cyanobacterium NC_groundwater_1537_Pr4_S-0.65um_50_18]|nr:LysE family translocator [Oscillatoriophycideae cyanobacterium NC_groundwater_1537_Pr4_S-0.65um_50_18]